MVDPLTMHWPSRAVEHHCRAFRGGVMSQKRASGCLAVDGHLSQRSPNISAFSCNWGPPKPIGFIGFTMVLPIKGQHFRRVTWFKHPTMFLYQWEFRPEKRVRTIHANGSSWAAPVGTERVRLGVGKEGENGDIPSGNLTVCYGQWPIHPSTYLPIYLSTYLPTYLAI